MKRRTLLPCLLMPGLAGAAPPAVTLAVEWRWVESALPPSAQAGVRDGAVVVGTAGAVSPRGPGVVTATAGAAPPPAERLLVLNGQRASLRLALQEPLQPVDAVVEIDAGAAPASAVRRIYARPGQAAPRSTQGITVTPTWPGGRAPVRVAFAIDGEHGELWQSTLDLPMERWQTVARTGAAAPPSPRGTVSSGDAEGRPERALQLRVSVQP
ncbi:hypothetical protein [Pelomonas cellulosilytica]|uniref:Uncharacterized protein n=1 Tax=Pelomonas cellulosilytica TaxID=2906762 RepID=A0ABS8Y0K3_9BURK|nr:hypothetical protein [Pelomonas sp. P8]MCE4557495.1 hypothetical protein [Pelomonas sp. P8]